MAVHQDNELDVIHHTKSPFKSMSRGLGFVAVCVGSHLFGFALKSLDCIAHYE